MGKRFVQSVDQDTVRYSVSGVLSFVLLETQFVMQILFNILISHMVDQLQ